MAVAVSVLTPTIPERREFLKECRASVRAQTFRSFEHLVEVDKRRKGCAYTLNQLARRAHGEWLFILADDDLMLPGCLEAHMDASPQADVVYGPPLVWGQDHKEFHRSPPGIPAVALIRADLWRRVEGYWEDLDHCEDRDFFAKAMTKQARFVRIVDVPTWVYRFHGSNKSRPSQAEVTYGPEPLPPNPDNITDPGTTLREVAHGR